MAGFLGAVTIYHADHRIGGTFEQAAPGSYR